MDFDIKIPVRVISGKDCLKNNAIMLKSFGKKCIIITGGKSALLSGALDDMKFALKECDIKYEIYDKIGPNPRIDHCHEAGEIARKFGADFIVGIGGGSPLDAAKAVAVYATNPSFSAEEIFNFGEHERNKALPLVLVGTTAGTGSEVGRVSVLTNPDTGRKRSIAPDDCFPTLTFADSKYTCSVPYSVTVSTALDAMAHVIEGYMSVKCGDIPTMFGEKAIALIWEGLRYLHETKENPDEELRTKLYYGSLYAGITLAYCGTAFPHPLGYILTENYGIPHGRACAAFFDRLMEKSEKYAPERAQSLVALLGDSSENIIHTLKTLADCSDIVINEERAAELIKRWSANPRNFDCTPGGYTPQEAAEALVLLSK